MNAVLVLLLVQAGASIAFAVHAEGKRLPAVGHADPMVAVEHGAQTAKGGSTGAVLAEGEVRWLEPAADKLTAMHGQHVSLRMPPMAMVMRGKDRGRLIQLKAGDEIQFAARRVNGILTATVV